MTPYSNTVKSIIEVMSINKLITNLRNLDVKQILLVSTKGNVQRKVCRRRILMSGCKALTINLQIRYLQVLNFYRKWRFPDVAQTQWCGVVTCNVISKKATVFISFQISLRPLRVYAYFNCVGIWVLFK